MPFLILICTLLVLLVAFARSPRGRGIIGELRVRLMLGKTKPGEQYVINDLMLKVGDGKTSQIDHIVINPNGVFVIETKNYSGRIYGSEEQLEWTQVLRYGKVKHKLYNPVRQNRTHIYRLSKFLSKKIKITSAVVFVQGNTQFINASEVYTLGGLKRLLNTEQYHLTKKQMEKIYKKLLKVKSTADLDEHIENIRVLQAEIADNVCPRCGKPLVLRSGRYGNFYGCSGYPSCKFTKKG